MATGSPAAALCRQPVVLASASTTRRDMLVSAGLMVEAQPAGIDEAAVKQCLAADGASGALVAGKLAELKALAVSRRRPAALVIGADQVLECDGVRFDKPPDRDAAAAQLGALSGRSHTLISAVCAARDGQVLWQDTGHARLDMRELGSGFIARYLEAAGDDVLDGPGAYRIETLGSHLFTRIAGDPFTILGLPLTALLGFLRQNGVVAS